MSTRTLASMTDLAGMDAGDRRRGRPVFTETSAFACDLAVLVAGQISVWEYAEVGLTGAIQRRGGCSHVRSGLKRSQTQMVACLSPA